MAVKNITDDNYTEEVSSGLVLVDFWAEWCGPCRVIGPVIEELAGQMPEVKFAKLNVDENQNTAQSLGITSIPTLLLYKNGQPVDKVVGSVPGPQLKNFLQKHI